MQSPPPVSLNQRAAAVRKIYAEYLKKLKALKKKHDAEINVFFETEQNRVLKELKKKIKGA